MDNIHTFDKYSENQEKLFRGKIKGKNQRGNWGKCTVKTKRHLFIQEIKGKMKGKLSVKTGAFRSVYWAKTTLWDFGQTPCLRPGRENQISVKSSKPFGS